MTAGPLCSGVNFSISWTFNKSKNINKVVDTLAKDNQALWVALHRSLAHKMDYHLALCYPSDILPVAQHLDVILWSALERSAGQHIPRREEGLGTECVLDIPVDNIWRAEASKTTL